MSDVSALKIGDRVIRYGKVLKVFQVKDKTIYFQPHFKGQGNSGLTYQMSLSNVQKSNMRKPVSKKELQALFSSILIKSSEGGEINALEIRSSLNENDLPQTLKVIKNLWLEKTSKTTSLASGKHNIYQQALEQAAEEVAAVKGFSPDEGKEAIMAALKKGHKQAKAA
jgi:RNA polymerase-interacting CarD/CdnL/TRCF family regulator